MKLDRIRGRMCKPEPIRSSPSRFDVQYGATFSPSATKQIGGEDHQSAADKARLGLHGDRRVSPIHVMLESTQKTKNPKPNETL